MYNILLPAQIRVRWFRFKFFRLKVKRDSFASVSHQFFTSFRFPKLFFSLGFASLFFSLPYFSFRFSIFIFTSFSFRFFLRYRIFFPLRFTSLFFFSLHFAPCRFACKIYCFASMRNKRNIPLCFHFEEKRISLPSRLATSNRKRTS